MHGTTIKKIKVTYLIYLSIGHPRMYEDHHCAVFTCQGTVFNPVCECEVTPSFSVAELGKKKFLPCIQANMTVYVNWR